MLLYLFYGVLAAGRRKNSSTRWYTAWVIPQGTEHGRFLIGKPAYVIETLLGSLFYFLWSISSFLSTRFEFIWPWKFWKTVVLFPPHKLIPANLLLRVATNDAVMIRAPLPSGSLPWRRYFPDVQWQTGCLALVRVPGGLSILDSCRWRHGQCWRRQSI